jgi:hypothetical protein
MAPIGLVQQRGDGRHQALEVPNRNEEPVHFVLDVAALPSRAQASAKSSIELGDQLTRSMVKQAESLHSFARELHAISGP